MSEQKVMGKLTHDQRMRAEGAMNALDAAGERIAALTAERDALKAAVERLHWQPITPENLPKVGDEVLREPSLEVRQVEKRGMAFDWKHSGYTHFRPINPPAKP